MGIFDIDENIERDPKELKFSTFYTRLVTNLEKSASRFFGNEDHLSFRRGRKNQYPRS